MMPRIALLLLGLWLALTLVGRWRRRVAGRRPATPIDEARRCPDCGTFAVAGRSGGCPAPGCPSRSA